MVGPGQDELRTYRHVAACGLHMNILQAGFVAASPAICGILGGVLSDTLLRRGNSLTLARKIPIVAGMLLAASIGCRAFVSTREALSMLPASPRRSSSDASWNGPGRSTGCCSTSPRMQVVPP